MHAWKRTVNLRNKYIPILMQNMLMLDNNYFVYLKYYAQYES